MKGAAVGAALSYAAAWVKSKFTQPQTPPADAGGSSDDGGGVQEGAEGKMASPADTTSDNETQQIPDPIGSTTEEAQANNPLNTDEPRSNPTVTGSLDGSGQVFGGVFGVSVSIGSTIDSTNLNLCAVITACFQVGLGVFAGVGMSVGAGFSGTALRSGPADSFGIFGNIAILGVSAGGGLNIGEGSVSGARGFFGVGKGAAAGLQFCRSSLSCARN